MENRLKDYNSSLDDKFSFPVMIPGPGNVSDHPFEFGFATNSPADHLFSNGKLLPHVFPIQTSNINHTNFTYSRSTSRTSSIGSKDSLMSSRSNSTNSSRSSSARTSTSADHANPDQSRRVVSNMPKKESRNNIIHRPVLSTATNCQYGSCKKWQFIAAAPELKLQGSGSSRRSVDQVIEQSRRGSSKGVDEDSGVKKHWFGKRALKKFVSACKECHAIKTSDRIEDVLQGNS